MKAAVGDQIVVESTHLDEPRRVGTIVALHHEDGSPPYVVRWEGQEHETLVFPGPDARIVAQAPGLTWRPGPDARAPGTRRSGRPHARAPRPTRMAVSRSPVRRHDP